MESARILIIEDDRDNLGLIRFILEYAGYTVLEAFDGRHGLEAARQEQPDLIVLDLALPEMDGWTVAKILKTDPITRDIKILVVTVRTLPEDRKRAMDAGVDGYITKPMNVSTFPEIVAKYLTTAEK